MLDKLLEEHRKMLDIAAQIREYLRQSVVPETELLIDLRWQLTSMIFSHVAIEDRVLYLPLEQDSRPDVAALARGFKVELEQLIEQYEEHVMAWPTEETRRRWSEYRLTALGLLDILDDRLAREEEQLYSIAMAAGSDFAERIQPVERNWIAPAWGMREQIFKGTEEY